LAARRDHEWHDGELGVVEEVECSIDVVRGDKFRCDEFGARLYEVGADRVNAWLCCST
jgi:hypothetical protein